MMCRSGTGTGVFGHLLLLHVDIIQLGNVKRVDTVVFHVMQEADEVLDVYVGRCSVVAWVKAVVVIVVGRPSCSFALPPPASCKPLRLRSTLHACSRSAACSRRRRCAP